MKKITLYRSDFRFTAETGSFFDGVLASLGIQESEWESIDEIELDIDEFKVKL